MRHCATKYLESFLSCQKKIKKVKNEIFFDVRIRKLKKGTKKNDLNKSLKIFSHLCNLEKEKKQSDWGKLDEREY